MIVVACSLPAGLTVEQSGQVINLNGTHVGIDMENLPRNGSAPDTDVRAAGFGLTKLEGDQEAAFLLWVDAVTKGPDGKPLSHPFAPIASGALIWAKSEGDVRKEAANSKERAIAGLDPSKDLPEGLQTSEETKKAK